VRAPSLLLAGLASLSVLGCGSSGPSADEDAKLRKELSGPPSLKGLADKKPHGAKQPQGDTPPAGATTGTTGGAAPATTGGG